MQSRWRSRTAWASVFALVLFILKNYYNVELPESDELVTLILAVMTAIGIFNNPKDSENF